MLSIFTSILNQAAIQIKIKKIVDPPGIEPGAFRLQSERDTTTPRTLDKSSNQSFPYKGCFDLF